MKLIKFSHELLKVGEFLDEKFNHESEKFYEMNGITYQGIRRLVKKIGGEWSCEFRKREYDTLRIPYNQEKRRGSIIIKRPRRDLQGFLVEKHRVLYLGILKPNMEKSVIEYLDEILRR